MAFEGRHLNKGRHQALKLEGLSGPNAKKRGGAIVSLFLSIKIFLEEGWMTPSPNIPFFF